MFLNLWNVTVNGTWQNEMQGNNVISFPMFVAKEDVEGMSLLFESKC